MVCLSKGLTGGTMPMGITAATAKIFDAFWDDDRSRMLYHGHSFTANATSCAASLASLDLLLVDSCTEARAMIEAAHTGFAAAMRTHPMVADVRHTGTIIALEINAGTTSYHSSIRDRMYRYFLSRNVILRPLGNIVYILPPYCITKEELNYIYACITDFLSVEAGTQ
jgi:adenosylmethionine-8-amino-7-oxononanoate aminotransferase